VPAPPESDFLSANFTHYSKGKLRSMWQKSSLSDGWFEESPYEN